MTNPDRSGHRVGVIASSSVSAQRLEPATSGTGGPTIAHRTIRINLLAPLKYVLVMGTLWASIAASAVIVPAIIGAFVLWSYCSVDKRRAPGASFISDALSSACIGRASIPGYRPTQRERRRRRTVLRGFWMPFLIGIPATAAASIALAGVGLASSVTFGPGYPVLLGLGILTYMIARTPQDGW